MVISPPIEVANLGMADTLILMVLALVVFGPRRLPQIGRQIGKLMYEFRKASNDFKFQMEEELRNAEDADRRKREEAERQRSLADAQKAVAEAQSAAMQAQSAAEQAQSAAQAAQSAVDSQTGVGPEALPPGSGVAETAETGLRVQPPSTGEQVAASRPGRTGGTTEAAEAKIASQPAALPAPFEIDFSAEEDPSATESPAHHG